MFTKRITTEYIQTPLNNRNELYSLYIFAQQGDDSRGLIARTLSFYEFLIFCIKVNPLTIYNKFKYKKLLDNKVEKQLNNIPLLKCNMITPLYIPKELDDELYPFLIDYSLSVEEFLLYSTYLLTKTKNPKHTISHDINYYYYNQPTWLHPSTQEIPPDQTMQKIASIRRVQKRTEYLIKDQKRLLDSYKELGMTHHKQILGDLKEVNDEIKQLLENIENH